jgi:hypothetical protein
MRQEAEHARPLPGIPARALVALALIVVRDGTATAGSKLLTTSRTIFLLGVAVDFLSPG